jgi:hypothetical protein
MQIFKMKSVYSLFSKKNLFLFTEHVWSPKTLCKLQTKTKGSRCKKEQQLFAGHGYVAGKNE